MATEQIIEAAETPTEARAGERVAPSAQALAAADLVKTYGRRRVVDGVSLYVEPGEVVGLLGANGAGKTTTFYMFIGLERANAGRITLAGRDITRLPMYLRARLGVGYLPQEPSVFRRMTAGENILAVLETMGLRRSEIARALATEPQFILLDEPFAGIDPKAVDDIQQMILYLRGRGIGILITDHNVRETLGVTDRAYIMADGRIFRSGAPVELTEDPEVRRLYLGEKFRM